VIAVTAIVVAAVTSPMGERVAGRFSLIKWLRGKDAVTSDFLVIGLAVVSVVLASFVLSELSSGLARRYIAQELTGRPLAFFRVPLIMGAILLGREYFLSFVAQRWRGWLSTCSLLVTALVLFALWGTALEQFSSLEWTREQEWVAQVANEIEKTGHGVRFEYSEEVLYYALACEVDETCSNLDVLLEPMTGMVTE